MFSTFWLANVLLATVACHFSASELQKVVRRWRVLYVLTDKCASRHSVQFFDIGASKSGRCRCVLHILTDKCASRHSGVPFFDIGASKSGPVPTCFVHFDLQMCLWPQPHTICPDRNSKNLSHNEVLSTFWLTNVLVATAACYLSCLCATATSAPAALATSGTTNHWKNTAIRDIPNIWRVCIFFLVTFLACWSSFCGLALLFNCPYCRKLDY